MIIAEPNLRFCNSVERGSEVLRWASALPLKEEAAEVFWRVMMEYWSSFDLIDHTAFAVMFARFRAWHKASNHSGKIVVFRGQDDGAQPGLSWTRRKRVAEGFARGHRGIRNANPVVIRGVITRSCVAFEIDERNEAEIVAFSASDIKVTSIKALAG